MTPAVILPVLTYGEGGGGSINVRKLRMVTPSAYTLYNYHFLIQEPYSGGGPKMSILSERTSVDGPYRLSLHFD